MLLTVIDGNKLKGFHVLAGVPKEIKNIVMAGYKNKLIFALE